MYHSVQSEYVDYDCCINPEHLVDLMRLRLGSHWLSVVTGHWTDGDIAWVPMYCSKCMEYEVEDERHFMMECPAYQEIRAFFRSCLTIVKVI